MVRQQFQIWCKNIIDYSRGFFFIFHVEIIRTWLQETCGICLYVCISDYLSFFQLNAIFFFNLQQDLLQGKCKKMRKLFIDVIKEDRTRRVYCCHFGLLMKPGNRLTIMVLCPISVCTCAHCVCKCLYMYNLNACSVRTGKHNETL